MMKKELKKSKFDIRQVIINLEQSFTELNGNNKMITSYKNVELNDDVLAMMDPYSGSEDIDSEDEDELLKLIGGYV